VSENGWHSPRSWQGILKIALMSRQLLPFRGVYDARESARHVATGTTCLHYIKNGRKFFSAKVKWFVIVAES
jgi:hypothetical protein